MPDSHTSLPGLLATHVAEDAAALIADVRAEARELARRRLVETYADALVGAVTRAPGAPSAGERPRATQGTGCYLYAVLAGDGTGAGEGEPGIDPARPVRLVHAEGLTALVSDVSVPEFQRGVDEADLSGWLATAVRAHEGVVDRAFRSATVVPVRFGALYPDDAAVVTLLRDYGDVFRRELDRLEGSAEWGVKAYAEARTTSRSSAAARTDEAVESGRAFLAAKQHERRERDELEERLHRCTRAVHDTLGGHSVDAVMSALPEGSDGRLPLLNASYLVPNAAEPAFAAALGRLQQELAADGITVERTGPWPPYHFVALQLGGDGPDA